MLFPNISGTARRCIGVLVLLPIIAAVFFDARIASIVIALIAIGMAYEFGKMVTMPMLAKLTLCLCIILQALPIWVIDLGSWWHAGLACLAFGITLTYHQLLESVFALVLALCLYFTVLLLSEPSGHWQLLMLAAVIAACDSAAYFVGRFIGGAKLAPAISPNKTISGSVGGIIAAMAVMLAIAPLFELGFVMALLLGFGLAVLSQIGDLLESALKRRVDVKDSGSILPGHGGLLDRFDGYLLTVPGFYFFLFVMQGTAL
jgi:phosphatidate cytidylyltransferase